MSESSSTPWPTSGSTLDEGESEHELTHDDLTADLDLGFDGAEDILRAWTKGMRPDPRCLGSRDAHSRGSRRSRSM